MSELYSASSLPQVCTQVRMAPRLPDFSVNWPPQQTLSDEQQPPCVLPFPGFFCLMWRYMQFQVSGQNKPECRVCGSFLKPHEYYIRLPKEHFKGVFYSQSCIFRSSSFFVSARRLKYQISLLCGHSWLVPTVGRLITKKLNFIMSQYLTLLIAQMKQM